MSQAEAMKFIPKLRYNLKARRKLTNPEGPPGRHDKIRKVVTGLFKHERLELNYDLGDEARGYAERLISDAIRYGDCHKPTMEMASYWIVEKQLVHKLFKVLAPRYKESTLSYTKLWRAPRDYSLKIPDKCVLELRNNIYPKLGVDNSYNKNLIHNVLLIAAKHAYRKEKAAAASKTSDVSESNTTSVQNENVNTSVEENTSSDDSCGAEMKEDTSLESKFEKELNLNDKEVKAERDHVPGEKNKE